MSGITRIITQDINCQECRYQSIDEEFLVEFQTDNSGEPPFGFIHCPACGGGCWEVSLDEQQ